MEEEPVKKDISFIVIGGSAGSLQVVLRMLGLIREDFAVPLLLVLHRNLSYDSSLAELLAIRTRFIPKEVEEKEIIRPGYIYICPADYHVLIEDDHSFSLDDSEKVNFSRPSIDVVFQSASQVYKENLLCILLSGANADGTEGLKTVKENNGIVVIQDPEEAQVPYMPLQALKQVKPDYILNSNEMAGMLNSLIM